MRWIGIAIVMALAASASAAPVAAYLAEPKLVIVGTHRPSDSCPDNAVDAIAVP